MTEQTTTITDRPNATLPLTGNERLVMDEVGEGARTVDAPASAVAALATKQTVGLGSVDNTSDANKPVSTAQAAAIADAVSAHVAAADPHPGYLTQAEGDSRYRQSATALSDSDIPAGIARDSEVAAAIGAHEAAADPHPGYLTPAEGNTAYEAAGAVAAHVAAADPHTQYVQPGDSPSLAGLTITGTAPVVIPHIHGSIAGNLYVHVRNSSGGDLTAGTAVYATGSVGDTDRIRVAACDPTDPLKMPAIGVLETTLANNGDGDAVVLGELRPFNTNSYQLGDHLYVGAGGAMVATIPASGEVQQVGSVVRVNVNTGTILVNTGAAMARVGFTGAYADLSGAPSIPSPADASPAALAATAAIGSSADYAREDHAHQRDSDVIVIPVGDESSALTTGTNRVRFRMPFAATLLAVRANVNTAPTGSTLIVDVNEAGASVLGTKLSIDATEFSSTTAVSAATITDSSLADDAEISIDIDQIGSTVAGAGLKVSLFVRRV
jgi:hypothetical protein